MKNYAQHSKEAQHDDYPAVSFGHEDHVAEQFLEMWGALPLKIMRGLGIVAVGVMIFASIAILTYLAVIL